MAKTPKPKWPKLPSIEIPLFGNRVYLARSFAEFHQALDYLKIPERDRPSDAGVQGCTAPLTNEITGEDLILVAVFDGTLRTLVHELAHAAFISLDTAGVETDSEADRGARETFCYLQDNLFSGLAGYICAGAK